MIDALLTLKAYFACAGLGLLIHMVLKFWGEDGKFSDNFLSAKTARYFVVSVLLTAAYLVMFAPDQVTVAALGSAITAGIAGGSLTSGGQRIAAKGKP